VLAPPAHNAVPTVHVLARPATNINDLWRANLSEKMSEQEKEESHMHISKREILCCLRLRGLRTAVQICLNTDFLLDEEVVKKSGRCHAASITIIWSHACIFKTEGRDRFGVCKRSWLA